MTPTPTTPGSPPPRARWLAALALLTAATLLTPSGAEAHPLSPPHVRIVAAPQAPGALLHLTVTIRHAEDARPPRLTVPGGCTVASRLPSRDDDGDHRIDEVWQCKGTLGPLHVDAAFGDPPVIVETDLADPSSTSPSSPTPRARTTLLDAATPDLALDTLFGPPPSVLSRLVSWGRSGAVHLLIGADHVLLVIGLVLLLGVTRRLVIALTGFTLGHSLSLALGATGTLVLPSAPVEAAIALTLVFLALSLVRPRPDTPAPRRAAPTVVIGLAIGLIHGLGFAGVMQDLDLGRDGLLVPIAGFNVGLEVAQLALVLAMAMVLFALRRLALATLGPLNPVAGWTIGIVAAAWTLERLAL